MQLSRSAERDWEFDGGGGGGGGSSCACSDDGIERVAEDKDDEFVCFCGGEGLGAVEGEKWGGECHGRDLESCSLACGLLDVGGVRLSL